MDRWWVRMGAAITVAGAVAIASDDVLACGGCFSPPPMSMGGGGSNTIQTVTDHRMVLAVSSTQTTLWDQFSYSGNPSEFAWILPIRSGPDVRVELASDTFMSDLDRFAQVSLDRPREPTRRCGQCVPASSFAQCRTGAPQFGASDAASFQDAASSSDSAVTVIREEVVGPYQVATLRGTDAGSLRAWLTSNGYAIPASIEPTLMHYIELNMDFIALRLRGGEGLRRMAPVRVRMPGSQPVLPLRMVAAGISDKVGMLLTVVADARLEAQNFANFTVSSDDLRWDFAANPDAVSLYRAAVAAKIRALGAAWQTESSLWSTASALRGAVRSPRVDADAGATDSDLDVALAGLSPRSVVVTRLRAELTAAQLDRDLVLRASTGLDVPQFVRFSTLLNTPTPAACPPLRCERDQGRFETDGTIYGPYSERVAPSTVFPAVYRAGSLPDHAPVERSVPPVACGGPPPASIAGGGPVGCSVPAAASARGATMVALCSMMGLGALLRRARQSRR